MQLRATGYKKYKLYSDLIAKMLSDKNKENDNRSSKEIINNTLPKEIVAFLNTDGGTIYIGINKNRTVVGVDNMDDSLRAISDIITGQISPRCVSFVMPKKDVIEGKNVIRIDIKKSSKIPFIISR